MGWDHAERQTVRIVIPVMNGLVAGSGVYAFLNAETWGGVVVIVLVVVLIILWGERLRRRIV